MSLLVSTAVGDGPEKLFARHHGSGAEGEASFRVSDAKVEPVEGTVYAYATIRMGPANPIRYVQGMPQWRPGAAPPAETVDQSAAKKKAETIEAVPGGFDMKFEYPPVPKREGRPRFLETITLGQKTNGKFEPAVKFGLADDGRAENLEGRAMVTPWVSDGHIDYFGPYARPNTPYDFKFKLDLKKRRMTAWICGRGDDRWFLLAEDVPLANVDKGVTQIDHVRVEQYPKGPDVEDLMVLCEPYAPAEQVQPHPLAKKNRMVEQNKGFEFQSLRSTWRKPGKHVTIFRRPGVHAGFPDVTLAGPKHLVCVWCNHSHTGGQGGPTLSHSYDLGKTWSEPVNYPAGRCPRIQRLKNGDLLLLDDKPMPGPREAGWDAVFWDSTDAGKTWTNARRLSAKDVGGGGCVVPSRICEMGDGSWLLAAAFADPKSHAEILSYYHSTDCGKTWRHLPQPSCYPPFTMSEPSLLVLPDERLFVVARGSQTNGYPAVKGFSTDGGKTWDYRDLPFPITGRTCMGFLPDGRYMVTFRSGVGRAALRAFIGDPDDATGPQPAGGHFNDRSSVGLKNGALHIDNDGMCGQFTKYNLKPPENEKYTIEVTAEVKVIENQGMAATISIPFAGALRIFPDHAVFAHDPKLRIDVTPGRFHTYRVVVAKRGSLKVYVDGELRLDGKGDDRLTHLQWVSFSRYCLAFGNEGHCGRRDREGMPDVYQRYIDPDVTGYSIWRRFEAVIADPKGQREVLSWSAKKDGFPDQYQLDHIIEVDASASGHEQGYSGWTLLPDGRIFVVHYTDDTSEAGRPNPHQFGIPWIRGTFLSPTDLPPAK